MKNLKKIFFYLIILIFFSSCNDRLKDHDKYKPIIFLKDYSRNSNGDLSFNFTLTTNLKRSHILESGIIYSTDSNFTNFKFLNFGPDYISQSDIKNGNIFFNKSLNASFENFDEGTKYYFKIFAKNDFTINYSDEIIKIDSVYFSMGMCHDIQNNYKFDVTSSPSINHYFTSITTDENWTVVANGSYPLRISFDKKPKTGYYSATTYNAEVFYLGVWRPLDNISKISVNRINSNSFDISVCDGYFTINQVEYVSNYYCRFKIEY